MLTQSFTHNGATFTLRQQTIFDEEMRQSAWIDLGNALAKADGLELKDLPHTVQRLSGKYVDWMQLTTVSPQQAYSKVSIYNTNIEAYHAWKDAILANGQELALLWDSAYRAVSQMAQDTDEKKDEPNNGVVSNGMPEPVLAETS